MDIDKVILEKFIPLWYNQQPSCRSVSVRSCCDLLKNLYLCGIINNASNTKATSSVVVICSKIYTFVV